MRRTKIVCTIGPATNSEEMLTKLVRSGMNVARLNFSHGTHEYHKDTLERIKRVRRREGMPVAILLDTKGPEIRVKDFKDGFAELREGAEFTLTTREIEGTEQAVTVTYAGMPAELSEGNSILIDDGNIELCVKRCTETDVICQVVRGGRISNHKGINVPNVHLDMPFLSEQDQSDILFGIENDVDFVAASFVSHKQDVLDLKNFLAAHGGEHIDVIAKIENRSGVDHIEEICEACEGIMIGRGDLGVEVPFTELPAIQKYLITKCRLLGKRVITATEMLESMVHNPRPTRAEISDVANAVYDGTSAIMLSAESAAGKYPVRAVETMASIAEETEQHISYEKRFKNTDFRMKNIPDAVSHATCCMAIDIHAKAIVVSSLSGTTVRMVSRFRAPTDIIGMATSKAVWYKLALSWGVLPVLSEQFNSTDVLFYHALRTAKELLHLQPGDNVVMTGGITNSTSGNTNTIKVETVR